MLKILGIDTLLMDSEVNFRDTYRTDNPKGRERVKNAAADYTKTTHKITSQVW